MTTSCFKLYYRGILVKFSEEDCLLRDKSHQSKTKQNKLAHLSEIRVKV